MRFVEKQKSTAEEFDRPRREKCWDSERQYAGRSIN